MKEEVMWSASVAAQQEYLKKKCKAHVTSVKNRFVPFDETHADSARALSRLGGDNYVTCNPPTKCERKKRKPKEAVIVVKVRHGKMAEKTVYTRVEQKVFCSAHNAKIQQDLRQKLIDKERAEHHECLRQQRQLERTRKEMTEWVNSAPSDEEVREHYALQGGWLVHFVKTEPRWEGKIWNCEYHLNQARQMLSWDVLQHLGEDYPELVFLRRVETRGVQAVEELLTSKLGSALTANIGSYTHSKHEIEEDCGVQYNTCGATPKYVCEKLQYSPQGMTESWRTKIREKFIGSIGDPEKVAKSLFHIETLIDTVILMYNSSSWKLAVLQLKTYLAHLTGQSVSSILFKEIWEMANDGTPVFTDKYFDGFDIFGCLPDDSYFYREYTTQGFTDYMDTFKKCFTCWVDVCNSEFVKKLRRMIAYCVALGLCSVTAIPFTFLKFEEFYTASGLEAKQWPELWTGIIDTMLWMYDKGLALFKGEPIMSVLGTQSSATEYEVKYSKIVGNIALYEAGHLDRVGMEPPSYEFALSELIESTTLLHRRSSGPEKRILASKLLELERVKVRVLTTMNNSNMRKAPFAFFLSGTSGVGKTTSIDPMIHFILRVNNMDVDPNLWTSLNPDDAYQSEMQHWHRVFKMDDIGQIKAEWEERPSIKAIIDYINNQPATALKADVDSKGKVRIEPDIVAATTNTEDFKAHVKSNEPLAIVRRFHCRLTMVVKPQYCLPGSTMIDPAKLKRQNENDEHEIPDAWFFTVERPQPTGFKHGDGSSLYTWKVIEYENSELKEVTLGPVLKYLRYASRKHFAEQREYLANNAWLHTVELCPHEMYQSLCEECNPVAVEPQGATSDKVFEKLQEIREWAYVATDHVPNPLKESKWFALPFEQVYSLGLFEKGLSSLRWASWLGAGFFAGIATLFACTTPYIMVIGVIAWIASYVYFSVMYIHTQMKKVKKYSMMVVQPLVAHKYKILGAAALVALIAMLRRMRPKAKVIGQVVTQACQEANFVPKPDETPRQNVYVIPNVEPRKVKHEIATMTHDQMVNVVERSLGYARFTTTHGVKSCCVFPYKGNVWIAPYHMMRLEPTVIEVLRSKGGINNNRVCKINSGCWRRVPGTDLALVVLVTVGEVLNTSSYYMQDANPPDIQAVTWVHKNVNVDIVKDQFCAKFGMVNVPDVIQRDVYTYPAWEFKMNFPTQEGYCVSALVARSKVPYIVGFHTAGRTNDTAGVAAFVTAKQLQEVYCELFDRCIGDHTNINVQVASQGDMKLDFPEYGVTALGKLHEKSPFLYQEKPGHVELFGAHDGVRRTYRSTVCPTVLSKAVTEVFGIEPLHGKPKGMNTFWPWHNDAETVLNVDQLDVNYLGMSYADVEIRYTDFFRSLDDGRKCQIRPLGHTATLSGVDGVFGIDAVKLNTSMGWPWCKPKSWFVRPTDEYIEGITRPLDCDEDIKENIARIEQGLLTGHREYLPFRINLKDEPVKLTKLTVRTFGGGSFEMLYLLRKYFLPLVKVMMDNPEFFECAVGINATSDEWTRLAKHLKKHGVERCMNGDYGKFDSRMINQMVLLAFNLLITCAIICGYEENDIVIMISLATEVAHAFAEYNGEYVLFHSQNLSGHALTVFINNIVNRLYMGYAYYELLDKSTGCDPSYLMELESGLRKEGWTEEETEHLLRDLFVPPKAPVEIGTFSDHVSLMCYGDDNNMTVSPECTWFNHTLVAFSLARVGVKYTMADKEAKSVPFIHFDDSTFLKRGFVWSEKLNNYMAPLELTSLYKTLHVCVKSKVIDEMEQGREALLAVNRELFFHGPEVFDEFHSKLEQVVDKCGMRGYLPDGVLPGYQYYETKYVIDNDIQLAAR
jgi:flagellar biosynthesis GTPase FlhF